jgi:hypothetical protein
MGWLVPDCIKAIWEVVKKVGKLIWTLLTTSWGVLTGFTSLVMMAWDHIKAAFTVLTANFSAVWSTMLNGKDTCKALMAAGWPSSLANGYAFVNTYIPLAELLGFLGTMVGTICIMYLFRVVKSFLPTIAS